MTEAADAVSPSERATQPAFLTQTLFDDFELPPEVSAGLREAGFINCTPIQAEVLPVALKGKDVAGQAQTGTGKTAAFLVTILTRLMQMKDREPGVPAAIIVAPTRELAAQIYEEACSIGRHSALTFVQIVGGVDYQKQADILKKGVDVVICTPGRIIDYYKQGIFKTEDIKLAVIDEADRLLDLGFAKDMRYILKKLPHYEKRQTMLFSATLSYRVLELTYDYMNLPEFISVTPQEITVDRIEQSLFHVGKDKKLSLLLGLLRREDWNRMLIFANTKSGVEWLSRKLRGNGFPAEGITGDLPQRKRFQLMEKFKNNQVKILVATDVASRGIHIEDISHVVNYDLPQDAENYVHRIGRTARAGKAGISIALACEDYVLHLEPLEQMLGYKIPVVWPEDDWYEEDKAGPVRMPGRPHGKRPTSRKGPSPDRGREKAKPRKEGPPPILMPNGKPRPAGYFPGTFFGFGPPGESAAASIEPPSASVDLEAVDESDVTETTDTQTEASVKKRRRRRRKKKSPAASAVEAQGSSPEPTVEEDESKPVPRRKSGSKPRSRSRGRTSAAKTRAGEAGDGGTTADVPSASGGPEADT